MNDLESKILKLRTMPGLVSEAVQLRQEFSDVLNEIKS